MMVLTCRNPLPLISLRPSAPSFSFPPPSPPSLFLGRAVASRRSPRTHTLTRGQRRTRRADTRTLVLHGPQAASGPSSSPNPIPKVRAGPTGHSFEAFLKNYFISIIIFRCVSSASRAPCLTFDDPLTHHKLVFSRMLNWSDGTSF